MSAANIRETAIALSYRYQSDLQTAAGAGNYWSLTKTNPSLAEITLATETDAADIGKGHEFAENQYLTNWDVRIPFEKFCSSEILAWLFAFGLGSVTPSTPASGAYKYLCTPTNPVDDGIELPAFTYVEAIRQGGSALFDRASVGCLINSFGLSLASGPGRANCRVTAEFVGCGENASPSGVSIPDTTTEHFLNAASAGITILGSDYVTLKRIVSLDLGWNNNIRLPQGFYPGSGTSQGAAVRGRMEHGDREASLSFVVRMESTSDELAKLLAQTEGTAAITLQGNLITGSTYNSAVMTFHSVRISSAVIGDDSGIVTIQCQCQPFYTDSDGIVTFEATTQTANIGAEEA